ncbi:MAG: hypothetical protein H6509_07395 [Bryobacterales bacterium]|nr:hypothetical protein [Bryobacterales bacterium]
MRAIKAAGLYFAIVFGCGFALGVVRQLVVVPRLGVMWAELLEAPFMMIAILATARWTVGHFALSGRFGASAAAGLGALALLLAAEAAMVVSLRGQTLQEYVAGRDPVSGSVYLLLLALFGVMPAMLARRPPPAGPRLTSI